MSVFRRGRLGGELDADAASYTSSLPFDGEILKATVWVNAVHLKLLSEKGILPREEVGRALEALRNLAENPPREVDPRFEDVHGLVEDVVSKVSEEAGGMLAYGKSRNDAVAAAIRIRAREKLLHLTLKQLDLVEALLKKAEEHADTIFPAYTHLQRAAPATLGFVLHSHAQHLLRNAEKVGELLGWVNLSPLGAAAVAGTSAPIDRVREAKMLGFEGVLENAMDATTARDFLIHLLAHLLDSAAALSKLSEELVIYSSQEFGLIELPDEFSSTSSIMPQKKNPVVAEIARTKVAEVLGELVKAAAIVARLPSGYCLDLQQATPKLWSAMKELEESFRVSAKMVSGLRVNRKRAYEACLPPTGIAEAANTITQRYGISFRKAHQLCGKISLLIIEGKLDEKSFKKALNEFGILGELSLEEFMSWMRPEKVVMSYSTIGSSNPEEVKRMVAKGFGEVERLRVWCLKSLERFERLYRSALTP